MHIKSIQRIKLLVQHFLHLVDQILLMQLQDLLDLLHKIDNKCEGYSLAFNNPLEIHQFNLLQFGESLILTLIKLELYFLVLMSSLHFYVRERVLKGTRLSLSFPR